MAVRELEIPPAAGSTGIWGVTYGWLSLSQGILGRGVSWQYSGATYQLFLSLSAHSPALPCGGEAGTRPCWDGKGKRNCSLPGPDPLIPPYTHSLAPTLWNSVCEEPRSSFLGMEEEPFLPNSLSSNLPRCLSAQ